MILLCPINRAGMIRQIGSEARFGVILLLQGRMKTASYNAASD